MKLTAMFFATVEVEDVGVRTAERDEQERALFRAMAVRIRELFGDGVLSRIDCSRSIGNVGEINDNVRALVLHVLDDLAHPVPPATAPKRDTSCN